MDFSEALRKVKDGARIAREGWNAGGQYVYHVPANRYKPTTEAGEAIAADQEDGHVPYGAYLAIKTVQGNVVPWLASQTDLLADDWAA